MTKVAIMFNTCDKFNDLWSLFFNCLDRFWKPNYDIYINSETLDYKNDNYNIINVHPNEKKSWSDRLFNCVTKIDSKYIICIEDECIIEEKVDEKYINQAINMLDINNNIACIHFMHIPGEKYDDEKNLPFVKRKYNYRNLITQQVCIWRKSKWLQYIKRNENPWEYECLGSARGVLNNDEFYSVRDDLDDIIKYGYGFIVYRGCFMKEELERLENKLSLNFDKTARPIKTRDEIEKNTNSDLFFYNRLRIKKRLILLKKIVLNFFFYMHVFED